MRWSSNHAIPLVLPATHSQSSFIPSPLRLAGGAQVIITQDMDLSRTLEAEWALLEAHSEDVHGSSDPQTQPSEAVPWWAYLITALLKPLM